MSEKIKLAFHKKELTKGEIDFINSTVENKIDELVEIAANTIYKDTELIALQRIIKKQQEDIKKLKEKNNNNVVVAYGGRRYGTQAMALKEYISKDKIRKILKKYEKCEIEYGIYFYKEIKELLEEK